WGQEPLPPLVSPPNALRSTGNTYQQITGNESNGTPATPGGNGNSPQVWNVNSVSRPTASVGSNGNQPVNAYPPNSANAQPFWLSQSGSAKPKPNMQPPNDQPPRVFGQRLRKLLAGPTVVRPPMPAPTSLPTSVTPSSSSGTPNPTTWVGGNPTAKPTTWAGSAVTPNSGDMTAVSPTAKPVTPVSPNPMAKPSSPPAPSPMAKPSSPPAPSPMVKPGAPAAVLAAPRIMAVAARPDWGWHGYDNFNQLGPLGRQPQTIANVE